MTTVPNLNLCHLGTVYVTRNAARDFGNRVQMREEHARRLLTQLLLFAKRQPQLEQPSGPEIWRVIDRDRGTIDVKVSVEPPLAVVVGMVPRRS